MLERAYTYLQRELAQPDPKDDGWWPAYTAWQTFAVKVLQRVSAIRTPTSTVCISGWIACRSLPCRTCSTHWWPKEKPGHGVVELQRRITNAMLTEAGSAHVEELSDPYLLWFWNSNVRSTAIALRSLMRSNASEELVRPTVRWLLSVRKNGRWGNTQENAWAMEALVAYYRKYESDVPDFRAVVKLADDEIARSTFEGRSAEAVTRDIPMAALQAKAAPGSTREHHLLAGRHGDAVLHHPPSIRSG